jgi:hypothetical protein
MPFHEEKGGESEGMGLIVWSLRYEHPLLISDFDDKGCVSRCWSKVYQATDGEEHPASEVVIPILLDTGELWGALNLESDKKMAFKPVDVDFLLLCARLLGVFIHEHMRWLTYEYATTMLRELTHGERQDGDRAVLPDRIAKHLQDFLEASEVTVAPWSEGFVPICDPVICPSGTEPYHTRPKGLSRTLVEGPYKPYKPQSVHGALDQHQSGDLRGKRCDEV